MNPRAELPAEQKRQALDDALASKTLARSEQLRKFLRFVCKLEITGQAGEISEYSIAVQALGRQPDYSPVEDSTVRGRAYELRQKLQRYYSEENPRSAVRIEFSKGSYVPHFVEVERVAEVLPSSSAKPEGADVRLRWIAFGSAGIALAALIALATVIFTRDRNAPGIDPIVREAWGPLLQPNGNVLICMGTNLYLIVRPDLPSLPEDVLRYPAPEGLYPIFRQHRPLKPGAKLQMHSSDGPIPIEEASGVLAAATILRESGTQFQLLPERVAPLPALRDRNVILFGVPLSSNAVTDYLRDLPLTVQFDPVSQEMMVEDRSATPPRKLSPVRDEQNSYAQVFGLITILPSRGSHGGSERTVVVSGITSVGSHGAMEFFSSPESLRDLKRRFAIDGYSGFPKAYQVVVKCNTNDTLLQSFSYASHRIVER